jgi:hypothetical protein
MLNLSQLSVQVKRNAVLYKNIGNYFPIDIISGGYGAVYRPAGDVSKAMWRLLCSDNQAKRAKPMNGDIYGQA